jgi:serine/threonine protein kinase
MLPLVAANERAVEMFLRETENTRALKHPNVVQLRDAGCADGAFFFTLDFCNGGDLEGLMKKRGGTLPIEEAVPLMLQVLDGLEYAHRAPIPNVRLQDGSYRPGTGLVHRDLKPPNVLLDSVDGRLVAKLSDFGLSKAFDAAGLSGQTRSGDALGTPVFMPREQVRRFKYARPDVDVWAAAATLYFLLTHKFVRRFVKDNDIWKQILELDAVPIRDRDPRIPPRLAEVIDTALCESPKIGFQTAAELKKALQGAC